MVLTLAWIKPPADSRTVFVDLAQFITIKVLTTVFHIKVPLALLNKYRRPLVADIPANILEVISGGGFINLQGKISTAQCIALLTRLAHLILPIKYLT